MTALDIEKLRAGDPATVAAFRVVLRRRIRDFFQKPSQVNDLTGSALLELLNKLAKGERPPIARVEYWVLNAASNTVRRELTRVRKQIVTFESQLHGGDPADQTQIMDARDELARIDALLAKLDETPVRVLVAAIHGYTNREIAEEVGITPGAARMSLSRLRGELKEHLSAREKLVFLRLLARQAGLGPEPPLLLGETTRADASSAS